MGNCCGKSSSDDNFAGTGRVLGSAPPQQDRASVPANANQSSVSTTPPAARSGDSSGAREAAARAAEARMQKSQTGTGKLERDLIAQKKKTQTQTLQAGAEEELQHRHADQQRDVSNYN